MASGGNAARHAQAKEPRAGASVKIHGSDDDIPNPFAADDVMQRLSESDKTKEFMKDPGFLEKLKHLSKDSQNLAEHMADHRVMTALAVLLDVDVKVPEISADSMPAEHLPRSSEKGAASSAEVPHQKENSGAECTSTGSPLPKSNSERILKCRELKEEGNLLVKSGEWKKAMKKYHHAIMYVKGITDKYDALPGLEASMGRQKPTEQEKKDSTELMLALWNNLSLCLLKLEEWEKVVNHTSKILAERPNDPKALYRRGKAYTQIGNLEAAENDLRQAHQHNPEDKLVKEQMRILQKKKVDQQDKDRKLYSAMFTTT